MKDWLASIAGSRSKEILFSLGVSMGLCMLTLVLLTRGETTATVSMMLVVEIAPFVVILFADPIALGLILFAVAFLFIWRMDGGMKRLIGFLVFFLAWHAYAIACTALFLSQMVQ